MIKRFQLAFLIATAACCAAGGAFVQAKDSPPLTYRHFTVIEKDGLVVAMTPVPDAVVPHWARNVSQNTFDWSEQTTGAEPLFKTPIPFVLQPVDAGEPFYGHNHQPSITWLPNGDLLAIWYSTEKEQETELTVLASRLRSGSETWDASSEFFKAPNRNMHGSSILHDGKGKIFHFNGMAPDGGKGWAKLALLMRSSLDDGVTWTPPIAIDPRVIGRHQVISGTLMTKAGVLIQNCDAVPGGHGGTALHISQDGGKTWNDPGFGKPKPEFVEGGTGEGTIAGIHAKVIELNDGRLMALGRGDSIDGHMPMSISSDLGKTWTYRASPFPPIGGGQRLVLKQLAEGPLLFVGFTSRLRSEPEAKGMTLVDQNGQKFTGHGMYAAVSFDQGETWPVRKLLTAGKGEFDGGAWTREFTATPTRAEHAGYLAATQTPDNVIHLISSRLHYRFNLAWLTEGVTVARAARAPAEGDLNSFLGNPQLDLTPLFSDERFPNITVTTAGTVLATWGSKHVRARRSEDGGQSWGEMITIAASGIQGGGTTVDETTGDILAFVEEMHPPAPLTVYRSADDGITWIPETPTIHPDSLGHMPSMHMNEHGITLHHGENRGRLIRPSRYYAGKNDRSRWPQHYTNAIYSDDGGHIWHTSDPFPENGTGEATLAELSDGTIYYNSRVHWQERPKNTRRRSARSIDGGQTWQDWKIVDVLPDGHQHRSYGCMGGLVRLPVAGKDILIFSNIDTPNATRERATVWASLDGGNSWPVKRLVYDGPSAYSSITAGQPGTPGEGRIFLHFESGEGSHVAKFNLSWLLAGTATGDGELPEDLRG